MQVEIAKHTETEIFTFMDIKIILASASPRRRELVKMLNCDYLCMTADADETIDTDNPALAVEILTLSSEKNEFL